MAQAPKLKKIGINRGVNNAVTDKKLVKVAVDELDDDHRSESGDDSVKEAGIFPTLSCVRICRSALVGDASRCKDVRIPGPAASTALPRVRDFKGINEKSFDGRGNYTLGITEQIIFPEVDIDKVNKITGMDITFVTTAGTNEEAFELLKELGMPFRGVKKD